MITPVVHLLSPEQAVREAATAVDAGCTSLMLIDMSAGGNRLTHYCALAVREAYPQLALGANWLSHRAESALALSLELGLQMTWTDEQLTQTGRAPLVLALPEGHTFFCAVAFKYQQHEPDPVGAAMRAHLIGMVPTTSGPSTGHAPTEDHLRLLANAGTPLALASGLSPENAPELLPYLTHALVATGVSRGFHELDPLRLSALMSHAHLMRTA